MLSAVIVSWCLVALLASTVTYMLGWWRGVMRKPMIPRRRRKSSAASAPTAPTAEPEESDEERRDRIEQDLERSYPHLGPIARKQAIEEIMAAGRQLGRRLRLD
ncbi:MAG: hypothetical protein AMS20_00210 [Gemmatimonas sp. SG8_28]|nr:MAG: hypothetical protein AMS20_00210 [Gemmatimonas sp. SG8_28]